MVEWLLVAWAAWEFVRCFRLCTDAAFAFLIWKQERQYAFHPRHGSSYWACLLFVRTLD